MHSADLSLLPELRIELVTQLRLEGRPDAREPLVLYRGDILVCKCYSENAVTLS